MKKATSNLTDASPRLRRRLPLSEYAYREVVTLTVGALVCCAAAVWFWWPATCVVVFIWALLVLFFRDPERSVPGDDHALVAPADGKVTEITRLDTDPLTGGPAVKIGIFLSVFDVHMNRSPCAVIVKDVQYRRGRFGNAMRAASSAQNEANTLVLDGGALHGRLVVRQIAGLIARRIVCAAAVGDRLEPGQRLGMIKFGSRTELVIGHPETVDICVTVGQSVRAGSTIMARRRTPVEPAA